MAQRRVLTLRDLFSEMTLPIEFLKMVKEIVTTIAALYKRFGPFGVNEKMIGGSSSSDLIVWINETFEICEVQHQLQKVSNP